jgi:shikimate kinase
MADENVALVKPASTIVWLQVSPAVAVRRMGARIRLRPLLRSGNPVQALQALLETRRPRYATADAVIDTEAYGWQGVIDAIAALAPPGSPSAEIRRDDPGVA